MTDKPNLEGTPMGERFRAALLDLVTKFAGNEAMSAAEIVGCLDIVKQDIVFQDLCLKYGLVFDENEIEEGPEDLEPDDQQDPR